jgi:hypothetical protein
MTALADLIGGIGTGLVMGRVQTDRASMDALALYRDEPLLDGARVPRMVLSEVTVEVRVATATFQESGIEVLVTADELVKTRPEHISTLTLKYTQDDLEPPPRSA